LFALNRSRPLCFAEEEFNGFHCLCNLTISGEPGIPDPFTPAACKKDAE